MFNIQISNNIETLLINYKVPHFVAYEGKKALQSNFTCVKWSKPTYDSNGEVHPLGEGRLKAHQEWLNAARYGPN